MTVTYGFLQIAEEENLEIDAKFRALVAIGSLVRFEYIILFLGLVMIGFAELSCKHISCLLLNMLVHGLRTSHIH